MRAKSILISGITGQDGSYLTELALERGATVHGLVRRTSVLERSRLHFLYQNPNIYGSRLHLHYCDLDDVTNLRRLLLRIQPEAFFHLAGQSHVGLSFEIPESTCEDAAMATLRILEILRDLDRPPRLFHAGSSEMFGSPEKAPQDESTPFRPVNPYGCAKAFATHLAQVYRSAYGLFIVNGILYNHESERRGEHFVTRKICRTAAEIAAGVATELRLGDTSARRDWGYAPDYVRGMWLALEHEQAEDYIFASGETHSVAEVAEVAFQSVGLDWRRHLVEDPRFLRPQEPRSLVGNPSKAERVLGWKRETGFREMILKMTQAESERLNRVP